MGTAFGYLPKITTNLDYRQATDKDIWIDDVESSDYNRWVKLPNPAKSFEYLKRQDDLYKYAVVVNYNTKPTIKGNGSAIFLHVWKNAQAGTAGCVALAEKNLVKILARLNKKAAPIIEIHQ